MATQPRQFDRFLAGLDPLFGRRAPAIKSHYRRPVAQSPRGPSKQPRDRLFQRAVRRDADRVLHAALLWRRASRRCSPVFPLGSRGSALRTDDVGENAATFDILILRRDLDDACRREPGTWAPGRPSAAAPSHQRPGTRSAMSAKADPTSALSVTHVRPWSTRNRTSPKRPPHFNARVAGSRQGAPSRLSSVRSPDTRARPCFDNIARIAPS